MNEEAINELLKLKNKIQKDIKIIDNAITILSKSNTSINKYKKLPRYLNMPLRHEILSILGQNNRFMMVSEIAEIIQPKYPEIDLYDIKTKVSSSLKALSVKKDSDVLPDKSGRGVATKWGLKKWLNKKEL